MHQITLKILSKRGLVAIKKDDTKTNDCIQMLLDFSKALAESNQSGPGEIDKSAPLQDYIAKIINALWDDKHLYEASVNASKHYVNRQYSNIYFSRIAVVTDSTFDPVILQDLTPSACKLLLFLATVAQSQYIQISNDNLILLTGMSKNTVSSALKELINKSVIYIARPRGSEPPIYKLSTAIVGVGKTYDFPSDHKRIMDVLDDFDNKVKPVVEIVIDRAQNSDIPGKKFARVTSGTWAKDNGSAPNTAACGPTNTHKSPTRESNCNTSASNMQDNTEFDLCETDMDDPFIRLCEEEDAKANGTVVAPEKIAHNSDIPEYKLGDDIDNHNKLYKYDRLKELHQNSKSDREKLRKKIKDYRG